MAREFVQPKLFKSTKGYYTFLAAGLSVLVLLVAGKLFYPKLIPFTIYIVIASISKYPKSRFSDAGDLIETTEFFAGYAYIMLGWWYAVGVVFLVNYIPFIFQYAQIEDPFEAAIRCARLIVGVGFLALILKFFTFSLFNAIMIYLAFELALWLGLVYGVMHMYDPSYIPKALVRWVLHYNVLLLIGASIGL